MCEFFFFLLWNKQLIKKCKQSNKYKERQKKNKKKRGRLLERVKIWLQTAQFINLSQNQSGIFLTKNFFSERTIHTNSGDGA